MRTRAQEKKRHSSDADQTRQTAGWAQAPLTLGQGLVEQPSRHFAINYLATRHKLILLGHTTKSSYHDITRPSYMSNSKLEVNSVCGNHDRRPFHTPLCTPLISLSIFIHHACLKLIHVCPLPCRIHSPPCSLKLKQLTRADRPICCAATTMYKVKASISKSLQLFIKRWSTNLPGEPLPTALVICPIDLAPSLYTMILFCSKASMNSTGPNVRARVRKDSEDCLGLEASAPWEM